jgi:hypothetical protein
MTNQIKNHNEIDIEDLKHIIDALLSVDSEMMFNKEQKLDLEEYEDTCSSINRYLWELQEISWQKGADENILLAGDLAERVASFVDSMECAESKEEKLEFAHEVREEWNLLYYSLMAIEAELDKE